MRALIFAMVLAACNTDTQEEATKGDAAEETQEAENVPPPVPDLPDTPADVAAAPEDAEKTASGLASKVLKPGTGTEKPTANAMVTVHYTGWTTDGNMFDSSIKRKAAASFGLNQVIAGWTEGLQLMVPGESRRFWIPEELAYKGQPGKPAGMLVFDVELVSFVNPPADVGAIPDDATKTESGLAYKVLKKGTGTTHPAADDTVKAHFIGWRSTGELLQSTENQPTPPQFKLNAPNLLPGWKEGLQLMVEGEKTRFWIPEDLAKVPGAPPGMVVFDFTMVEIVKPIPAPANAAEAPSDATKTESGLAYKVVTKGTGTDKPTAESAVKMHFTGWDSDGKMFDSSVQRGTPITIPLGRVPIKAWSEGVPMMVAGEKALFWVPADMAAGGPWPGIGDKPILFEIELLEILQGPGAPVPPIKLDPSKAKSPH